MFSVRWLRLLWMLTVRDLKFRPKKKKGKGGAGSADHDEKEAKKGDSKPNEK